MTRGSHAVGLWSEQESSAPAEPDAATEAYVTDDYSAWAAEQEAPSRDTRTIVVRGVAIALALGWTGLLGWSVMRSGGLNALQPAMLVDLIVKLCVPLALIALGYLLFARGGRAETARLAVVSGKLRDEQVQLAQTLAALEDRLTNATRMIGETTAQLNLLGTGATRHLDQFNEAMSAEIGRIGDHGEALRRAASTARADVALLLADLPRAHAQARKLTAQLEETGLTAHEQAGRLDGAVANLVAHGREADEVVNSAAQKLAAHLARVESATEVAGARLSDAAQGMAASVDAALEHAARAQEAARQGFDAHSGAIAALLEQAQSALANTGADSSARIAAHVEAASERVQAMSALLNEQGETTARLLDTITTGLSATDAQFAALDSEGRARHDRLAAGLAALEERATALRDTMAGTLDRGDSGAAALLARTATLRDELNRIHAQLDDTLPAAFGTVLSHTDHMHGRIEGIAPQLTALGELAGTTVQQLGAVHDVLAEHRATLDSFGDDAVARMQAARDAATGLVAEIERAESLSKGLAEGAGTQLVEALIRVRDAAQAATDRARESIGTVIPDAAARLSDAARTALHDSVDQTVAVQIARLSETAAGALASANEASDRLMRQMLTVQETSAAMEARVAEAHDALTRDERDNFARRVALLIESLNSTAIDVTKILSNDVTDSAWAAYLRGDRGVFTRRAVKLLDAGEAREIVRHYEAEPEFRDQVNRYIHDFEAMLRNTLATRDGSALSVTLLSSDMGKLYVALAQAIERLRT